MKCFICLLVCCFVRGPAERTTDAAKLKKRLEVLLTVFLLGALIEIKKMQRGTELLIRKLPFNRLVREISQEVAGRRSFDYRYQADAIMALQEASEMFLINYMAAANLAALHSKRVTLQPKDMNLVKSMNENFNYKQR